MRIIKTYKAWEATVHVGDLPQFGDPIHPGNNIDPKGGNRRSPIGHPNLLEVDPTEMEYLWKRYVAYCRGKHKEPEYKMPLSSEEYKEIESLLNESKVYESKNYSDLYHYTSIVNAAGILRDNILYKNSSGLESHINVGKKYDIDSYISLTRDRKLHKSLPDIHSTNVVIMIDGDKLSENYKIIPYNDFHMNNNPRITEKEERVLLRENQRGIKDISKYIKKIDIIDNYAEKKQYHLSKLNELRDWCVKRNIPCMTFVLFDDFY